MALLSFGLINSAAASKARYPYTLDKDLKAYGENSDFFNIKQIEITWRDDAGVESKVGCSAVRVDNFLLTAAHCLENNKKGVVSNISIFQPNTNSGDLETVTGYFVHPHFEQNRADDLAAVYTTAKADIGFEIASENSLDSKQHSYVSVGFGKMRSGEGTVKQAFDVCGNLVVDHESKVVGEKFNSETLTNSGKNCGIVSHGDSGGALLQHTEGERLKLAGINAWGGEYDSNWRAVDDLFIETARKINANIDALTSNEPAKLHDLTPLATTIFPSLKESTLKNQEVIILNGLIAQKQERYEDAIKLYEQLPDAKGSICSAFIHRLKVRHADLSFSEFQTCKEYADLPAPKESKSIVNLEPASKLGHIQYYLYSKYHTTLKADFTEFAEKSFGNTVSYERMVTEKYLESAARNGNIDAIDYYIRDGKKKLSAEEIVELYNKPAKDGNMDAQYKLAVIYMPDNIYKAIHEMTARHWYSEADLREKTATVEKDCALAKSWLDSATEASLPAAEYALGLWMGFDPGFCSGSTALTIDGNAEVRSEVYNLLQKASSNQDKPSNAATEALCSLYLQDGDNLFAYKYCLKVISASILRDPANTNHVNWLKTIFTDINSGNYLPSGKELEKLTAIQANFKNGFSIDRKPYLEELYGADNVDAFYNTELPKLIADAPDQTQYLHEEGLAIEI